MTPLASAHLTEDQFTGCIIEDEPDDASQAHLAQCADCRQKLSTEREAFHTSVAHFNAAGLAWSESHPYPSLRGKASAQAGKGSYAPMRWALATLALALVALPVWNYDHPGVPVRSQSVASSADDSALQIAQDNQLMQSVNVALAENEPSPLHEYRLAPGRPAHVVSAEARTR